MLDYEQHLIKQGYKYIVGTDEAGRGPLAGPVVAAAVIFPSDFKNDDINDSKKLSDKKRRELFEIIKREALAYAIIRVEPEEIDRINIYESSRKAMTKAILALKIKPDYIVTDCMKLFDFDVPVEDLVKGDAKCISIAAASILAKVTRDDIMIELDKKYPQYGFKKHKGYPTKDHLEALKKYGPIKGLYRYSYAPVQKCAYEQLSLID